MLGSSLEWEPEQQHLGELGLVGIWLEILLVFLAILPAFASPGPAFLLVAHVAVCGTFFSRLVAGGVSTLLRLIFSRAFFLLLLDVSFMMIFGCMFSLSVTTFYRTKGAVHRAARNLVTKDMSTRHSSTLLMVVPVLGFCVTVSGDTWRALRLLHDQSGIVVALQLLGGAACLAATAYIALVCQLACVVSVLEDASDLGAMRRSRALFARGNFWRAAAVFVVLDGFFVAALINFPVAVWDAMLDGSFVTPMMNFPVAVGDKVLGVARVLQVALCVVVVVTTLLAQPVVYLVLCDSAAKNYRHSTMNRVEV